jgi:hypothetical protein
MKGKDFVHSHLLIFEYSRESTGDTKQTGSRRNMGYPLMEATQQR